MNCFFHRYLFSLSATYTKIAEKAYIMHIMDGMKERTRLTSCTDVVTLTAAADSDGEESVDIEWNNLYMKEVVYKYESSIYSSSSEEYESHCLSPIPDDANS